MPDKLHPDIQAIRLCSAIYDPNYSDWDKIWTASEPNGIYAAIKDNTIVFRGSVTLEDWFRDFIAFPHYGFSHPQLGLVHAGFNEGMDEFFKEAIPYLGPNPNIVGHSLGAARAFLFGGRCVIEGHNPGRITGFGTPKPGCEQLRAILRPILKASYRNGLDPVPLVPVWQPALPVVAPCDLTKLDVKPIDPFNVFSYHHPQYYEQGVEALYG